MGRPTEFTDDVVKKLEAAFALDCTVTEACFYAGITRQTYYNHVNEEAPEGTKARKYFDRFQELRNTPVLKARKTVVDSLNNPVHAQWYLKHKRRDEFSERTENVTDLNIKEEVSPEVKRLANLLNELHRGGDQ